VLSHLAQLILILRKGQTMQEEISCQGFSFVKVKEWAQEFESLGWVEKPGEKGRILIERLIHQGALPSINEPDEPWIFLCSINEKYFWKPHKVRINNKSISSGLIRKQEAYIVATRCRLGILDISKGNLFIYRYEDIEGYSRSPADELEIRFRLHMRQGDVVEFFLGPGTRRVVAALGIALFAGERANTNHEKDELELYHRQSLKVEAFFQEIADIKGGANQV
jgi:hypothetical protein